jgi:hypothetical protein
VAGTPSYDTEGEGPVLSSLREAEGDSDSEDAKARGRHDLDEEWWSAVGLQTLSPTANNFWRRRHLMNHAVVSSSTIFTGARCWFAVPSGEKCYCVAPETIDFRGSKIPLCTQHHQIFHEEPFEILIHNGRISFRRK